MLVPEEVAFGEGEAVWACATEERLKNAKATTKRKAIGFFMGGLG